MLPSVLIVDNDVQILETMRIYLEDVARVHTVLSGLQAVEYVQQHHVDIIFLDIEMPIMDGFLTLEQLRNVEACINVPVVLVTGKQDKQTVFNSYILGVDGYLVKPVSKETLINKINELCVKIDDAEQRRTVLLIDDDMTYLKQLNNILHDKYNVIMINSAKLALDYLLKHTPDVIVLDFQMPLYNGAAIMNMIQKNNPVRPIPVIVLSGALNITNLQECYPYRPVACLAKPISKEVLIENIEKALNR